MCSYARVFKAYIKMGSILFYSPEVFYYLIPEKNITLKDIPKIAQLPANKMSESDQLLMREWAHEHGQAVRQRTVRQNNTKYASGTLPLNEFAHSEKNLPIRDGVIFENDDQQSEYDSDSDEETERTNKSEDNETNDTLKAVNFLSRSIHSRSGRVITMSNRALSSYQ